MLNAGRGANALALAEKAARPIDLLVTDISMPGMTGWDLAGSLRTQRPGLPVLFTVVSGPGTLDFTGTNLSFTGAGSVVVQATQPGDGTNYNAAVPVMQSVQVSLAQSSITWTECQVPGMPSIIPVGIRTWRWWRAIL